VFECRIMRTRSHAYRKISTVIERLEQNQMLYAAENFIERMRAIDVLELQMLDEIEQVNNSKSSDPEILSLMQRTRVLKQKLDDVNERLFAYLLASIRSNDRSTVKQYFQKAEQQIASRTADDYVGYDEIDMLVNGLLEVAFVPVEPEARDADMLFYQPTPARIILKLIDELQVMPEDTFYDLGSGLGHVPILVNLLTGIQTKGVELEDSYVRYSGECVNKLGLVNVAFINADARHVDYDDGTIFYMYTPFQGDMLRQVLVKLEAQSKRRPIKVCTYGPCTSQVSKQKWLQPLYQTGKQEGRFGIFCSQ
jgi:tRNA/tmRNA/rRNA uracil-C5-methylase (TrmA/RlmC/RlmD family)